MSGRRAAHGFTLLEVMVSVALLGIGLVAVLGLLNTSLRITTRTAELRRDAEMAAELCATLGLESRARDEAQRELLERYPGRRYRLETRPTLHPAVLQQEIQIFHGDEREPSHRLARFVEVEDAP